MRLGPKRITREMMEAALAKQWDTSATARFYGMHRSSVAAACERFGISLPLHRFAPTMPSRTKPKPKSKPEDHGCDRRVKAWSASPAAIARALRKHSAGVYV